MVEEIIIDDKTYTVEFLRKGRRHWECSNDKTFTVVTQCIIREKDGLYIGVGESVKDSRDKDDEVRGKRVALKYALTDEPRRIRKLLWNKLKLGHNGNNS